MTSSFKDIYRPIVSDRQYVMPFGKHKGITVAEIMENEPQYLVWLHDHTDFELDHILLDEAEGESERFKIY